ncbi:MAG: peptide/nickel transport system ATP-binding protein [Solirubrobacteraceae bacterium]|jgi:oligopeptide/dipeptide ABC transporter ATP-binding protein|nr:peptide/nickel transport system ATP-binding protein [Solirubrobacteraceae bacterium]
MSEALVELRSVTTRLLTRDGLKPALIDVDCDVRRGEILGLVGESGSGKSMTARTIIRALPDGARTTGRVAFDGEDLLAMPPARLRELRGKRMGMIFQEPRAYIDPLWRVEDHLTEGMRVHDHVDRQTARQRAGDLLEQVGIADGRRRLRQYPGELSGGMLQRVMIAGALAGDPDLLIADEATTALDVTTQAEIVRILGRLRDERGLAVLFITHDLALASTICDRICVMYAGRIVEAQDRDGIFGDPRHPYTHALLGARPSMSARQEEGLEVIPGRPTSAMNAPPGCSFHPRCPYAQESSGCMGTVPPLEPVGAGQVACLRHQEIRPSLAHRRAAR